MELKMKFVISWYSCGGLYSDCEYFDADSITEAQKIAANKAKTFSDYYHASGKYYVSLIIDQGYSREKNV